jgi:alginate O-acetyltransferase complex protein AlgI
MLEYGSSVLNAVLALTVACSQWRPRYWQLALYVAASSVIVVVPMSLTVPVALCSVTWLALKLADRRPARRRPILVAALCLVALVWAGTKWGGLVPQVAAWSAPLGFAVPTIGVSFLVLKLAHMLLDGLARPTAAPRYDTTLAMGLFPPTYAAGPMHRYEEFRDSFEALPPWRDRDWMEALRRVVIGLAKVRVLGYYLGDAYALGRLAHPAECGALELWLAVYAYGLYIYLNFSGVSDIAIGLGAAMGVRVPENFSRPYMQVDLQAFWRSWHITFTRWLQAYIFVPIAKRLVKTRLRGRPRLAAGVGYLVTFACCGLWHGEGVHSLLWGLWHGLGLWAYTSLPPRLRAPAADPAAGWNARRVLWWFVTYQFVSFGWVLFACPTGDAVAVVARLFGMR